MKKKIVVGTREIQSPDHGTYIEISDLKGSWSEKKIRAVSDDISKLQSIFSGSDISDAVNFEKDFEVWIFRNNKLQKFQEQYFEKLNNLLNEKGSFSY